jgi:hypothetical protein
MIKTILFFIIRLWAFTLRFNPKNINIKKPAIIAFWHANLFPVWACFAKTGYFALVSKSRDGRRLGELLKKWNYQLIHGSSSKGGIQALQEMISAAENNCVLLTPDGPRGPKEKMKPGTLLAAQFANVPIYLIKPKYKGFILKKTWDKSKIPFPFAKIDIAVSEPIYVNTDLSDEQLGLVIKKCEEIFRSL